MTISREQLYDAVWTEPMTTLAARYGVSSNYLARVCECLNVPHPPRGYWAKRQFGKAEAKPALPPSRQGDDTAWSPGVAPAMYFLRRAKQPADTGSDDSTSPDHQPVKHRMLIAINEFYDAARVSDEGYLRPHKRLLVDLYVSKETLARALEVANQLFLFLERARYNVTFAPSGQYMHRPDLDQREKPGGHPLWQTWTPARATVTFVDGVAIGLTLYELSEEVEMRYVGGTYVRADSPPPKRGYRGGDGWTTKKDVPSGRLAVRAYSPHSGTTWTTEWRESKPGDLLNKFPTIRRDLKAGARTISELIAEAKQTAEIEHQRWEAQHREWLRRDREQRRARALKESREDLLAIVEAWALTQRIEQFFADADRRSGSLPDEQRSQILDRLQHARKLLGSVDALERFSQWRSPADREPSLRLDVED